MSANASNAFNLNPGNLGGWNLPMPACFDCTDPALANRTTNTLSVKADYYSHFLGQKEPLLRD